MSSKDKKLFTPTRVAFGIGAVVVGAALLMQTFSGPGAEPSEPSASLAAPGDGPVLRETSWDTTEEPAATPPARTPQQQDEMARAAEAAQRWQGLEIAFQK